MQFSCESAQLAKAVNTVKKAISSSPNAPIFLVSIWALTATLWNLLLWMSTSAWKRFWSQWQWRRSHPCSCTILRGSFGQVFYGHSHVDPKEGTQELTLTSETGTYHIPWLEVTIIRLFLNLKENGSWPCPKICWDSSSVKPSMLVLLMNHGLFLRASSWRKRAAHHLCRNQYTSSGHQVGWSRNGWRQRVFPAHSGPRP